jgi:membrane dipeptidase
MRVTAVLAMLAFGAATGVASEARAQQRSSGNADMDKAIRVLSTTPLFDGHNDLPWAIRNDAGRDVDAYDLRGTVSGHTDIERLRRGMVGVQFWSVYIPSNSVETGASKMQLEQIDIAKQVFAKYPDVFVETTTPAAALAAFGQGRVASVIGMEGGHAIENSLGALRAFFGMGARYMTLTHSRWPYGVRA